MQEHNQIICFAVTQAPFPPTKAFCTSHHITNPLQKKLGFFNYNPHHAFIWVSVEKEWNQGDLETLGNGTRAESVVNIETGMAWQLLGKRESIAGCWSMVHRYVVARRNLLGIALCLHFIGTVYCALGVWKHGHQSSKKYVKYCRLLGINFDGQIAFVACIQYNCNTWSPSRSPARIMTQFQTPFFLDPSSPLFLCIRLTEKVTPGHCRQFCLFFGHLTKVRR